MKLHGILGIAGILATLVSLTASADDLPLKGPKFVCMSKSYTYTAQVRPGADESEKPVNWLYAKIDGVSKLITHGGSVVKFKKADDDGLILEFDEITLKIAKQEVGNPAPKVTIKLDLEGFENKVEVGHCIGNLK